MLAQVIVKRCARVPDTGRANDCYVWFKRGWRHLGAGFAAEGVGVNRGLYVLFRTDVQINRLEMKLAWMFRGLTAVAAAVVTIAYDSVRVWLRT